MTPNSTRLALLAAIVFLASPCAADAGLTFDLRAVSATGGAHLVDSKHVDAVPGFEGEVVAELWAVITGANAVLDDDRINNFAVKFLTTGSIRANLVNQPGVQIGWRDAGFNNGTVQDLDGDGDMDIGGNLATTTGYALGRGTAPPAYAGQAFVAEFLVYRFSAQISAQSFGLGMLHVERHASPTAYLWSEDGGAKNPTSGFLALAPGIQIGQIPEPSTITLALFVFAGVVLAFRRRTRAIVALVAQQRRLCNDVQE
jgi:hypothetical protein